MPTLSSAGIGSGLDVEGIIKGLVGVERQPIAKLQEQAKSVQTKLSAVGQLQGQLSTLRDAARKLSDVSTWKAVSAVSSDAAALGVTAGAGAIASNYQVQVTKLASAQQLASANFPAGGASAVGSGTLTIELGSWNADHSAFSAKPGAAPVSVNISPGENSLEAIRDKINAAGSAVIASIVTDAHGARLTLRSRETGADNGFRISAADDDGTNNDAAGLSALAYDPAMFDYGQSGLDGHRQPADLGFAGFRVVVHTAPEQDMVAFLGASYFRAVGGSRQYGLSARGLAVDTALPRPEEFPDFTEFYLERPAATSGTPTTKCGTPVTTKRPANSRPHARTARGSGASTGPNASSIRPSASSCADFSPTAVSNRTARDAPEAPEAPIFKSKANRAMQRAPLPQKSACPPSEL